MKLSFKVIESMKGRYLGTAESCTGGSIAAALTAVPGCSTVYKGGIISYTNQVKEALLGIEQVLLEQEGAVSAPVAEAMALGAKKALLVDAAVSVTGLAGPAGDEFGNPVGTVFIGYCDEEHLTSRRFLFKGDRQSIINQSVEAALNIVLQYNSEDEL